MKSFCAVLAASLCVFASANKACDKFHEFFALWGQKDFDAVTSYFATSVEVTWNGMPDSYLGNFGTQTVGHDGVNKFWEVIDDVYTVLSMDNACYSSADDNRASISLDFVFRCKEGACKGISGLHSVKHTQFVELNAEGLVAKMEWYHYDQQPLDLATFNANFAHKGSCKASGNKACDVYNEMVQPWLKKDFEGTSRYWGTSVEAAWIGDGQAPYTSDFGSQTIDRDGVTKLWEKIEEQYTFVAFGFECHSGEDDNRGLIIYTPLVYEISGQPGLISSSMTQHFELDNLGLIVKSTWASFDVKPVDLATFNANFAHKASCKA